jgi:hypothetical protein
MGPFKRRKQQKQAINEALGELQHYTGLAGQMQAKVEQELGMDTDAIMSEANRAMAGGGAQQMMAYSARMARLTQAGVETAATVRAVALGESAPFQGGRQARLDLTVEPPGGTRYDATTEHVFPEGVASGLAEGQRITVKVDPNDPQSLMVWSTAQAPAAADDARTRLAKLEALHERGVLTDEEFEAQRAKLEGPSA